MTHNQKNIKSLENQIREVKAEYTQRGFKILSSKTIGKIEHICFERKNAMEDLFVEVMVSPKTGVTSKLVM